jgi:cytochrome b
MSQSGPSGRVKVWDPVVRYGHWLLVAAFAIAYLSAEEESGGPDLLHVWGGYAVGAIVVLRVLWGFVGSRHARFGDFIHGPFAALRYLADLLRGRARRYLGHSPAGGMMVLLLLAFLAATVATGLIAYGDQGKGPLAMRKTVTIIQTTAQANETAGPSGQGKQSRHEEAESALGELHDTLANITLALIILHVLGVGLASVVHRENLVAAMINGKKRARD